MSLLSQDSLRSDEPDLEAAAAAATAAAASPNPNLEAAVQPSAPANMHRVTGTFADPSHESAFAAQLFHMCYPIHVLLMALILSYHTCALVASEVPAYWAVLVLSTAAALVCRVLLHRMHDSVRSQWMGSWAWAALNTLGFGFDIVNFVVSPASACLTVLQEKYMPPFQLLLFALINGSHGLGFACKFALIAIILTDRVVGIAACHDPELDPWFICAMGTLVIGSATIHTAELCQRRNYAEKVQAKMQEQQSRTEEATRGRRLEERNEQLQAEKERLLYDVQRRGRPLDDDDDRSAIRRGLQAKPSRQPPTSDGDTTSSDRSGAKPSPDSPPPSLPPGPPSSASSGTTAPPYTWAKPTAPPPTVAELVARQEVAHVLLSCARGQTSHQCQSASVAGAACSGVAATRIVPSAASIPLVAPRHQWHALSGDGFTAAPTPSVASTHTPTSSVAAAAASHELTGSLGCSQSNTNCLMASNGEPTPEQALLVARRDILVSQDQIHVHRVVRTLGMALGATRLEVGTLRALHAVLLQQARPGMNDMEAYRSTGASKSNFQKWRRRVEVAQPRSTL